MRHTIISLAVGLLLPLSIAHADVAGDIKAGLPLQTVLMNALKEKSSIESALREVIAASPEQAYAAITAALQLSPDQAATIVSIALAREYNLNPPQVVAAALQGAPEKAGIIVPTAIVKSPSYYTVPIVQRALADGVDGSKFLPQAIRTAPRQGDSILAQALRSAPQQTEAIMKSVIADQPDKATQYVRVALDAKAPAADVLAGAFKGAPRQADQIAAIAKEKGVPTPVIAGAASSAKVEVAGLQQGDSPYMNSQARQSNVTVSPFAPPSAGGGGGGSASPN
ncbi:MAG: hypothetical protein KBD35_01605 [Moraxellaceae bacterium]|nr:hypothetical protein [Moraxellaceae bacterium]MBP8852333.1 hypothetical protein [Moraxellaceae bacterium]MBP9045054.1 hypothetical protein [Moraxellaceae bacterium]MBP9730085.1 hypothetical protein [Moraxellaceae bacterium]